MASTLTTLIVFLPMILGAKSDLTTWLKEIAIAIVIALGCSLFSSLTLVPLMSAHFLGRKKAEPIAAMVWLEERYAKMLRWTLKHGWLTLVAMLVFMGIGLIPALAGKIDAAIFSGTVNERVFLQYDFADFTYKSKAERTVDKVEAFLDEHREEFLIKSVYSFFRENRAQTTMTLTRKNLTDDELKELKKTIREVLPEIAGVKLYFDDDSDGGGDSTYFAVKFFGQDSAVLEGFANEALRRIETIDGIQDLRTSFKGAQREVRVKIDREKARRSGLAAQDLADIFSFTLGAMRLPRFNTGDREVDTWLALRIEDRENLADLKRIQIGGTDGRRPVQLGDIASFEIIQRPQEIRRENRKVRVHVRGSYEGDEWDDAKEEIAGLMDAFALPAGYSWSWNDRIVEQEDRNAQMGVNFLLALFLVYLVIASLFESLAQPFAILLSIGFAAPGVIWMLALTGTSFNLMAQIGILILMGIVVNNGIVLLDYVNQLRISGLGRDEAIIQAGRERLRPILMTAATTVIGLLPLAIRGPAAGGMFYYPLARTVMGGLISASVVTLLVLPRMSTWVEFLGTWLKGLWKSSARLPQRPPRTVEATASRDLRTDP